jgi:hypothetical protein
LVEAIAYQVQKIPGLAGQLAAVLSKVKLVGVEIDLSRVGQPDGTSIPQVLDLLSRQAGLETGESAMFALKSARDQMNSPNNHRLLLERVADALEKIHPWFAPMNVDRLFEAFKAVGLRPKA